MRTLVGVFGWTLYSDHDGLSSSMLHSWREKRYSVGEVQALLREEVFGIFIQALWNRPTRSLSTLGDKITGILLDSGDWAQYIPLGKVYKQAVSCDCFHFLAVVTRLRYYSSEPFAYAMVARIEKPSKRNKSHQTVLQMLLHAKI